MRIVGLQAELSYDEMTERKSGGLVGMAACLLDGRLLCAVDPAYRRQRIGTLLTRLVMRSCQWAGSGGLVIWVGKENESGNAFAQSVANWWWGGRSWKSYQGETSIRYSHVDYKAEDLS